MVTTSHAAMVRVWLLTAHRAAAHRVAVLMLAQALAPMETTARRVDAAALPITLASMVVLPAVLLQQR